MTKAEEVYQFILESLQNGKTIYLQTAYNCTKVTPKTVANWDKAGRQLFKIDETGFLCIASGKRYNAFCSPKILMITVKAI